MNFALSSHFLMAHWVPGFLVVMAVRPILVNGSSPVLKSLVGSGTSGEAIATLAIVVAAFLIGEVLDASRNLLENVWDLFQPVTWEFFAEAEKDKVNKLRTSHLTYYVFNCNASLALFILVALACFTSAPAWGAVTLLLFLIIFAVNAWKLRSEMAPLTRA